MMKLKNYSFGGSFEELGMPTRLMGNHFGDPEAEDNPSGFDGTADTDSFGSDNDGDHDRQSGSRAPTSSGNSSGGGAGDTAKEPSFLDRFGAWLGDKSPTQIVVGAAAVAALGPVLGVAGAVTGTVSALAGLAALDPKKAGEFVASSDDWLQNRDTNSDNGGDNITDQAKAAATTAAATAAGYGSRAAGALGDLAAGVKNGYQALSDTNIGDWFDDPKGDVRDAQANLDSLKENPETVQSDIDRAEATLSNAQAQQTYYDNLANAFPNDDLNDVPTTDALRVIEGVPAPASEHDLENTIEAAAYTIAMQGLYETRMPNEVTAQLDAAVASGQLASFERDAIMERVSEIQTELINEYGDPATAKFTTGRMMDNPTAITIRNGLEAKNEAYKANPTVELNDKEKVFVALESEGATGSIGDIKNNSGSRYRSAFNDRLVNEIIDVRTNGVEAAAETGIDYNLTQYVGGTGQNALHLAMGPVAAINARDAVPDAPEVAGRLTDDPDYMAIHNAILSDNNVRSNLMQHDGGVFNGNARDESSIIMAGVLAAGSDLDQATYRDNGQWVDGVMSGSGLSDPDKASLALDLDMTDYLLAKHAEGEAKVEKLKEDGMSYTDAVAQVRFENPAYREVESAKDVAEDKHQEKLDERGLGDLGLSYTPQSLGTTLLEDMTETYDTNGVIPEGTLLESMVVRVNDLRVHQYEAGEGLETNTNAAAEYADNQNPTQNSDVAATTDGTTFNDGSDEHVRDTTPDTVAADTTAADAAAADTAAVEEELTSKQRIDLLVNELMESGDTMKAFMAVMVLVMTGDERAKDIDKNELMNYAADEFDLPVDVQVASSADKAESTNIDFNHEESEVKSLDFESIANSGNIDTVRAASATKHTAVDQSDIRNLETAADAVLLEDENGDGKITVMDKDGNKVDIVLNEIGAEATQDKKAYVSLSELDDLIAKAVGNKQTEITMTDDGNQVATPNAGAANDDLNQQQGTANTR